MKYIEILEGFELEIGLIDDVANKPNTNDSLFWLNQAVAKFTKLRFNGDNVHKQGFEQTEKRRKDLIGLQTNYQYDPEDLVADTTPMDYDEYDVRYPKNLLYMLDEKVIIKDLRGENLRFSSVFECTLDNYMYRITNSLTDFHYRSNWARPISIKNNGGCKLLTDKNYKITCYSIDYLRKPNEITLNDPYSEYEDFESTVMYEIIKMAAQMYLENTKNERYKTISEEVLTQE